MDFSALPQRKIKSIIKALFLKTGEEVVSFNKELEEMKNIQKQKINEEQSVSQISESIGLAEEAVYDTLIANVELEAVLALTSKGFEIMSVAPGKNSSSNAVFKKNGIDLSICISDNTRILMEETIKSTDVNLKTEQLEFQRK